MTYQDAVVAAATALQRGEDANWELARLTFENTRARVGDHSLGVPMQQWCNDVRAASGRKFSLTTGQLYKAMWHRFRSESARPSWMEALDLLRPGNSAKLEQMRNADAVKHLMDAEPEQKRDVVRNLINDPAIRPAAIAALAADDSGHQEVFSAYLERRDREDRKERLRDPEPEPQAGDVYGEALRSIKDRREYIAILNRIHTAATAIRFWDIEAARAAIFSYRSGQDELHETLGDLEQMAQILRRIAAEERRGLEVVSS